VFTRLSTHMQASSKDSKEKVRLSLLDATMRVLFSLSAGTLMVVVGCLQLPTVTYAIYICAAVWSCQLWYAACCTAGHLRCQPSRSTHSNMHCQCTVLSHTVCTLRTLTWSPSLRFYCSVLCCWTIMHRAGFSAHTEVTPCLTDMLCSVLLLSLCYFLAACCAAGHLRHQPGAGHAH
jgi:hypothetical protein